MADDKDKGTTRKGTQQRAAVESAPSQEAAVKAADGEQAKEQEKARAAAEERTATEAAPVALPDDETLRSASGSTNVGPGAEGNDNNLSGGDVNPVAVGVGLISSTGERTGGLVGESGDEINVDTALDYGDGTQTFVTVRERIYETFYLPGSYRPLTRLLYASGARLSRETAERLKAAVASDK